jgi:hypothetical protein
MAKGRATNCNLDFPPIYPISGVNEADPVLWQNVFMIADRWRNVGKINLMDCMLVRRSLTALEVILKRKKVEISENKC